jgi:hypothetical protein
MKEYFQIGSKEMIRKRWVGSWKPSELNSCLGDGSKIYEEVW